MHKHNTNELVEEVVENVDVNSLTEGSNDDVELLLEYQRARAIALELEAKVIGNHRPSAKKKIFGIFDKYKNTINSGFVGQFR